MRKIGLIFFVILIMILSLAGCKWINSNNENDIQNLENLQGENQSYKSGDLEIEYVKDGDIKFEDLESGNANIHEILPTEIKDFSGAFTTIDAFWNNFDYFDQEYLPISPFITSKGSFKEAIQSLGYVLEDVNGDGKNEMLLYDLTADEDNKNTIVSMYSIYADESGDNLSYLILNSSDSMFFELCNNGVIKLTYNEDGFKMKSFYNIDDNVEMDNIETIGCQTLENGLTSYVKITDENENAITITKDEALDIEAKYLIKKVDIKKVLK